MLRRVPHHPHRPAPPARHLHHRLLHRRAHALRTGRRVALLAVVGPGLLAGLSDDDPAGITTYAVLGAEHGYALLWVLTLSTAALILFHELGARLGVITGMGLLAAVRHRFGPRAALPAALALVVANAATMCAELAGVAAGADLLFGTPKTISVPLACAALGVLVLRGSFKRIEHVLLALATIFASYVVAGLLARPDWSAAAHGLLVPSLPGGSDAVYLAVATLGTTLAPWGLAFIQSYAADKHIPAEELAYERLDVVTGAVLTGVIGLFVAVASAATLHASGTEVHGVEDLARGLEPLAGNAAAVLFGAGFIGAALLAGAIVPLSTAYSLSEANGRPAGLHLPYSEAPFFYRAYVATLVIPATVVLVPGAPLVTNLIASQALNAVLLLAVLPYMIVLGRDRDVLGQFTLSRRWGAVAWSTFALIAAAVTALGVLTVG